MPMDGRFHLRRVRKDRRHCPAREPGRQLAPRRHEAQSLLQSKDPGGLGGGELTEAVPQDYTGANPQTRPERSQRTLQGIDGRLCPLLVGQVHPGPCPAEHHLEQRGVAVLPQHGVATVQHRPHHRLAAVQLLAHADPMAALPGEHEGHLGRCLGGGPRPRRDQRAQTVAQGLHISEHDTGPVCEVTAPDGGGPGHVCEHRVRGIPRGKLPCALVEPRQVPTCQIPERLIRSSRQRQEAGLTRTALLRRRQAGERLGERNRNLQAGACG